MIKNLIFSLVLGLLGGCLLDVGGPQDPSFGDLPHSLLTPIASPEHLAEWEAKVRTDAESWNSAMLKAGCPEAPFDVGAGGHEVRLIARADWTGPYIGEEFTDGGGYIVVRADEGGGAGIYGVLLHEMGHAMGLHHEPADRAPSVMTSPATSETIRQIDVEKAACALGCWCLY